MSQNSAAGNVENYRPTMPGYQTDTEVPFKKMYTPEDQIHWLYRYLSEVKGIKADYPEIKREIAELNAKFEQFMRSGFDDYYRRQVIEWIDAYLSEYIDDAITFVMPGLTEDGHFCVWFPQRWRVVFDCIMNYASENYGKLSIKY